MKVVEPKKSCICLLGSYSTFVRISWMFEVFVHLWDDGYIF